MKTRLVLTSLLATCAPCFAALYTENFASGLGTFDLTSNNTGNGNSFGWSDSNYTSATPGGELGGVIARVDPSRRAYVATSSILSTAGASTALQLSGEGNLQQNDFDGNFQVGYIDTGNVNSFLGINFGEPGGGSGTAFRAKLFIKTDGGSEYSGATIFVPVNTPFTFDLTYTPGPVTGVLAGLIAGQAVSLSVNGFGTDSQIFNAFGLQANHLAGPYNASWAGLQTGSQTTFDALTYSVPEASSALLSLVGALALMTRRSRRNS